MKLWKKVVLALGGSTGLARASAQACAEDGTTIVTADINETAGKQMAADLEAAGGKAMFVKTNGTVDEDTAAALRVEMQVGIWLPV
jgi:NAD(P)-dependent dehydrogenase (short-subunit alcohol dehydrogenase family)